MNYCEKCRGLGRVGIQRMSPLCDGCGGIGLARESDSEAARLLIAKLTGISAHIRAVSAYDRLHGDADVIDEVIAHLARQPAALCPACGGNNADMPCAYPRAHERQPGCLKYQQPAAQPERRKGERRTGEIPDWNPSADIRKADRRQPAAREPEGQWVPKVPTIGMIGAVTKPDGGKSFPNAFEAADFWRRMLRASEPAEGGG